MMAGIIRIAMINIKRMSSTGEEGERYETTPTIMRRISGNATPTVTNDSASMPRESELCLMAVLVSSWIDLAFCLKYSLIFPPEFTLVTIPWSRSANFSDGEYLMDSRIDVRMSWPKSLALYQITLASVEISPYRRFLPSSNIILSMGISEDASVAKKPIATVSIESMFLFLLLANISGCSRNRAKTTTATRNKIPETRNEKLLYKTMVKASAVMRAADTTIIRSVTWL